MKDFTVWLHAYDAYAEWDFVHRYPFSTSLVSSPVVFFILIMAAVATVAPSQTAGTAGV